MGIIEQKLVLFSINNDKYSIEYNAGDSIHIHINNMRLEMSTKEFKDFCQVILDGKDKLLNKKDIK
jgi:hypothetical protein